MEGSVCHVTYGFLTLDSQAKFELDFHGNDLFKALLENKLTLLSLNKSIKLLYFFGVCSSSHVADILIWNEDKKLLLM